ncbi:conserved Plasmodium protein, unknown function [Plasmodium gallinaceum]|uniref:MARVEL domain-containing protein n=1 Tax=Plasmodium gallinaceum TaxID=5849 RepID=A0A1J1GUF7_PLAGA|nr:conserved Plasmodium protein, unknown function [Plasmodium gallinaceum]CRG96117.1 conserved Plasmodium protein, unknown function [Plasmodium gallinaceum]
MAISRDIATSIFGLIASSLLFAVAGTFNELTGVVGCFIFLGGAFTIYTIITFLIPSMKNSRDLVFSYGVSTACMFVACIMTFIILTYFYTKIHCHYGSKYCARLVFGSIFGFLSSGFFLVSSMLSLKIAHVW